MSVLTQFFPAGGGSSGIPVELMVMSGGGGGGGGGVANPCFGYGWAAGGGAMFYCRSFPLQPGVTYPITVGSGGAGGACGQGPSPTPGSNGSIGGSSCFTVPVDGGNISICVVGGGGGRGGGSLTKGNNGGTGGAPGSSFEYEGRSYYGGSSNCNVSDSLSSGGYFGYGAPANEGGSVLTYGQTHWPSPSICGDLTYNSWVTDIYGSEVCLSGGGKTLIGLQSCSPNRPSNCAWGGSGGRTYLSPSPSPALTEACPGGNGGSGVVVVKYPTAYGAAPASPGATNCSPATPGFYTYRFTSPGSITLP